MAEALLDGAPDEISQARLLAVSHPETGTWLNVLPLLSLGLCMEDDTVWIAVGLCFTLCTPLCRPHRCHQCGAEVDNLALRGLSCWHRHPRHASINDIIHRSLTLTRIPSHLEPQDLYRLDGSRPDGVSTLPWKRGRVIVWDVTYLSRHICSGDCRSFWPGSSWLLHWIGEVSGDCHGRTEFQAETHSVYFELLYMQRGNAMAVLGSVGLSYVAKWFCLCN